jgi:hypothetical protein
MSVYILLHKIKLTKSLFFARILLKTFYLVLIAVLTTPSAAQTYGVESWMINELWIWKGAEVAVFEVLSRQLTGRIYVNHVKP